MLVLGKYCSERSHGSSKLTQRLNDVEKHDGIKEWGLVLFKSEEDDREEWNQAQKQIYHSQNA